MRYIMRKICLFPVMIAVIVFTGCGQKKNEDPVTVTLWHVYGGQTESPLNDLIDEFNETIGKEENIRVQVGSVTNTNTIHENVLASAFGDPGASEGSGQSLRLISEYTVGTPLGVPIFL